MAIQKDLLLDEFGSGYTVTGAYISVADIRVNPAKDDQGNSIWRVTAIVTVHTSEAAKTAGAAPISQDSIQRDFDASLVLSYLYTELKALSKYTGAVDV